MFDPLTISVPERYRESHSDTPLERVRELARRHFEEFMNGRSFECIEEMYSGDVVIYGPQGLVHGHAALRNWLELVVTAFPDCRITLDHMLVEGGTAICRITMRGTQSGPLMGLPPTGRKSVLAGMARVHVQGGRITEVETIYNSQEFESDIGQSVPPLQAL